MKKYIPLLAIALTALTPSVHAVDITETDVLDYTAQKSFYHPAFQKRYLESDILTKITLHPGTKPHLDTLLSFAFKCSLLPKDIPLKEKERTDVLSQIEEYDTHAFLENRQWFEDCLNTLENLDTKYICDCIASTNSSIPSRNSYTAFMLAKKLIPFALHQKKTEEARYFYQQITQRVPEEFMQKMKKIYMEEGVIKEIQKLQGFQSANILNAQLIKNAAKYDNADAIIQTLLDAPYQITQGDMDCGFALSFFSGAFPASFYGDLNEFFRLFSNPKIKPSLEMIKQTLRVCDFLQFSHQERDRKRDRNLSVNFLRFFIGCQSTDAEQEQSKFNLKGDLKKLTDNVGQYPE